MKTLDKSPEAVAAIARREARRIRSERYVDRRGPANDARQIGDFLKLGDVVSLEGRILGRASHWTGDGVAVRLTDRTHTTTIDGQIVLVSHVELFRLDFAYGRATAEAAAECPF